ncbi:hypothetical protein SERLA73DRAFT_189276 [Serpula lacrymans var. lacrymans S7.3]|uniref:Dienelactone hydrolase domain-containing protein n=2 Tax=Serpula lacrymans var. lacrymans TaxID=341189 RepID=F8QDA2_SERL3|nr:uncharacterized protein SERLADRAFT_480017 [Serpula lacrymans var. lacrymans S7.9]EGN93573.1 hypothetical protein SERLA73DRAFT_189276 [Serpula lacrymans var. lacrymans S7.3]EGO18945.1 hypothetical protein SERLADRAFT_480017 [Serpula lacrymans var. lacrymans S7.9]
MSSSTLLAGPLGDACFKTVKHTGTPVGRAIEVAGVPTYISEPAESTGTQKKVILFFADVFGPFYLNNKLVQDYFASFGFTVLGIDYFFGDSMLNHMDDAGRPAWIAKAKQEAAECAPRWIEAVKETYGTTDTKYCAVGYCFGAPFATDLAATDSIVAAAFAHPSALSEEQFQKVKKPLLLSCAEVDRAFPVEARRRAEDILVANKTHYHIQVFAGVSHGFATRGDLNNETECWAKEESARGIIGWFSRFASVSESKL